MIQKILIEKRFEYSIKIKKINFENYFEIIEYKINKYIKKIIDNIIKKIDELIDIISVIIRKINIYIDNLNI